MSIESLVALAPPPERPIDAPPSTTGPGWDAFKARLGTDVPQDYKEYIVRYGTGDLIDYFSIHSPFSGNPGYNFFRNINFFHHLKETGWKDGPYQAWPAPGGLIVVGSTDVGDLVFWKAVGDPADWTIVWWDRGMIEFYEFDCGLTAFLESAILGKLEPDLLPEDLRPFHVAFHIAGEPSG